ncbi:MAG: hypothetical protein ONB06_02200 [candidate division KSB1 bacterium]|nr:hypothetical protein [candidate division KSB1 bacterium]
MLAREDFVVILGEHTRLCGYALGVHRSLGERYPLEAERAIDLRVSCDVPQRVLRGDRNSTLRVLAEQMMELVEQNPIELRIRELRYKILVNIKTPVPIHRHGGYFGG